MRKLLSNEEGSVFPLIGVLVVSLVGATGAAIDTGRAQLVQSKLSSSLDAAGLAAGATLSTASLQTEAQKYLDVNFNGYMGAKVEHFAVTIDSSNSIISLSAEAKLPTTFMKVLGINTITVGAESQVTRQSSGLELVMVLDNTGSMAGTKLTSLKSAATDLVNILYGNNSTVENLWIGLVPFAQAVNIGTSHSAWTQNTTFNWGPSPSAWGGCVDARETNNRDVTDDPPSVALFPKYYWPCDTNNKWYGTNTSKDNCSTTGTIKYKTLTATLGPNAYCSQPVTPLTANKSTVLAGINAMTANGNTHIGLGAAWGWRMLSPRWQNLWGGEMNTNHLPLDYGTPKMNKAVIIMTDGDNTIDNTTRGAYWYLSSNKLGTTTQSTAETRLDQRLSQVCTSMKNNNIIVYTISFGTVSNSSQTMLRNCASQSDFYFPSPSSSDLQLAFRAIGDSLANLRVSR